jgi:hypothetical protein
LPNEEDYLLRPVLRGLCSYESLKNGTLDLADIALLNDAIEVAEENERRIRKARNGAN